MRFNKCLNALMVVGGLLAVYLLVLFESTLAPSIAPKQIAAFSLLTGALLCKLYQKLSRITLWTVIEYSKNMPFYERFKELKRVKAQLYMLERIKEHLLMTCQHHIAAVDYDKMDDENHRCHCEGCGIDLGWQCSSSPDRVCHYETAYDCGILGSARVFRKIDGDTHIMPVNYDPSDESEDHCIFCGLPEERR